ncbi:hypothetical protein BCR33DRAFT_771820 [Rhizoclosmatium globosum]|uniref:RTA1-domain-containing protein n=1 Tax=Rhizoclosmatium globosum TaxID=329046 RepID=A0A1Y2B9P5_9FUNG|nr:hypothetical protein BCR33DRAFT_771820 [Rhizoclosmatium globosum]|eukprot:ORY31572.1 hypothetical protein BCR33DRAFT_771820 [Rhizoclosmatium globosum]
MSSNTTTTTSTQPQPMFPPGYIPDYPRLSAWDSPSAAFVFMAATIVITGLTIRNLFFSAKTQHSKSVYVYLLFWCTFRIVAFAMRGHDLLGTNGQDYEVYKYTQIVLSIGFMPLAEVLCFNVAEASTLIYELSHKTYIRLRILVSVLFVVFGTCVTAYVMDFTLNKPFGSNAKDYETDLVLREVGFNGLFLITIYTLFAAIRNSLAIVSKHHIPPSYMTRMRTMMRIVAFQSILMIIKLIYITYRNWNPKEFRDEVWWYVLSITPEYVFMLFFLKHDWFMSVYDEVEMVVGEDGNRDEEKGEAGKKEEVTTVEVETIVLSQVAGPSGEQ